MASTPSIMVPLKTKAVDFKLFDTISKSFKSLNELKSDRATIIVFICNHCPYVLHIKDELVRVANEYIPMGVSFIAISSNDIQQYPEDGPQKMSDFAVQNNFPFPYLYDETQETAKAYDAQCTPDFFVYNDKMALAYRGQFDDSRPKNDIPITGRDLTDALDAILRHDEVNPIQKPSIGCNIKWKRG
jgi:thiol-disulfide isomerase/thioredoxin